MSGRWIGLWNDSAAAWAETMLRVCWQGGLLAILAWVLCRLARRIPAQLCAALWLVVCLKMLVGLSPLSVSVPLLPAEKVVQQPLASSPAFDIPVSFSNAAYVPETAPTLSIEAYLFAAWAFGVAALIGVAAVALGRMRSLTRRAIPVCEPAILEAARVAADKIGLRSLPRVLRTDAEVGALTIGAIRPTVLLSRSVVEDCSAEELGLILAHELAHVRRRDAWLALAPQAMTVLFFFNPFAWLATRELELARETACDEMAINALGARSDLYGRLLLKLGSRRQSATPIFALRISSHFRVLSRRITMLDQVTHQSRRRLTARAALLAALAGIALIAPWNLVHAQAAAKQAAPPTSHQPPSPNRAVAPTMPQHNGVRPESKATSGDKLTPIVYTPKSKNTYQVASELHDALGNSVRRMIVTSKWITVNVKKSMVQQVIARLHAIDRNGAAPATPKRSTESVVFQLRYSKGADLVRTVREQLGSNAKVKFNEYSNCLLVDCTADQVKQVQSIVLAAEKLQRPSDNASILKVVSLKNSNATDVARKVLEMFKGNNSTVTADSQSNSVIIQAVPTEADQMVDAAKKLDVAPTGSNTIIRKLPSTLRKYVLKNRDAAGVYAELAKSPLPSMDFISYDRTDNSILVRVGEGFEADLDKIGEMIARIDHS